MPFALPRIVRHVSLFFHVLRNESVKFFADAIFLVAIVRASSQAMDATSQYFLVGEFARTSSRNSASGTTESGIARVMKPWASQHATQKRNMFTPRCCWVPASYLRIIVNSTQK